MTLNDRYTPFYLIQLFWVSLCRSEWRQTQSISSRMIAMVRRFQRRTDRKVSEHQPRYSLPSNISKMVQDRAIRITADWYEVVHVYGLPNGAIFNDSEWPLTQISRARHYSTMNISETIQDRHVVTADNRLQQNVACWIAPSPITLNDLQDHFSCFCWK